MAVPSVPSVPIVKIRNRFLRMSIHFLEKMNLTDKGCHLALLRHPESEANTSFNGVNAHQVARAAVKVKKLDADLSGELGVRQSKCAARHVSDILCAYQGLGRKFSFRLQSSPLKRAKFLADTIQAKLSDDGFECRVENRPYVETVTRERFGDIDEEVASLGLQFHNTFEDYAEHTIRAAARQIEADFIEMMRENPDADTHIIFIATHSLFIGHLTGYLSFGVIPERPIFHIPNVSTTHLIPEFKMNADGSFMIGTDGKYVVQWIICYTSDLSYVRANLVTGHHGFHVRIDDGPSPMDMEDLMDVEDLMDANPMDIDDPTDAAGPVPMEH